MDGPRVCHTEWSKSEREKQIPLCSFEDCCPLFFQVVKLLTDHLHFVEALFYTFFGLACENSRFYQAILTFLDLNSQLGHPCSNQTLKFLLVFLSPPTVVFHLGFLDFFPMQTQFMVQLNIWREFICLF